MYPLGRHRWCAVVLAICSLACIAAQGDGAEAQEVRVCVPYKITDGELANCTAAFSTADTNALTFICSEGGSAQQCVQELADGTSHVSVLDGGDVAYAHRAFGLQPVVVEKFGDRGPGHGYAIAVVHKELCEANPSVSLASLQATSSCHGGYRTMAGWNIPVGVLHSEVSAFRATGKLADISDDAELVAQFFSKVCAPRTSDLGPRYVDGEARLWKSGLCSVCKSDCTDSDDYYSDEGALRCLTEGGGDVAFVSHTVLLESSGVGSRDAVPIVQKPQELSDLRLLCKDGCFSLDEYRKCNLGQVSGRALIVAKVLGIGGTLEDLGLQIQTAIVNASQNNGFLSSTAGIVKQFAWSRTATRLEPTAKGYQSYMAPESKEALAAFEDIITSEDGKKLRNQENTQAAAEENGMAQNLKTPERRKPAVFCARNPDEHNFCKKVMRILNDQQEELWFSCYDGANDSSCLLALGAGKADWAVVDAADIAFGYSNLALRVVVAEEKGAGVGTNYFAVAVVKKEFCESVENGGPNDTSLANLRGVNSCHTGYRKNAGWRMPVGLMISQRIMAVRDDEPGVENDAESVAAFFNSSCAPRVANNGPKNTPDGNGELWTPLCERCKGSCDNRDQYYDYSGALRCLIEGQGEVAFVKHSTVLGELPPFAASSTQEDFRLLCGDKPGCHEVTEYPMCHLARVPSHGVIVASDTAVTQNSTLQNVLVTASRTDAFKELVFSRDRNPYNHIFSKDAVGLSRFDGEPDEFLGNVGVIYSTLESIEVDPENWVDSESLTVDVQGNPNGTNGHGSMPNVHHLTVFLILFFAGIFL